MRRGAESYLKGKIGELVAREYVESLGYTDIVATTGKGPDLVAKKGGKTFTFEVKLACRIPNTNSWSTAAVCPNRRNDDFMAIVFPNGKVFVCTMTEHHQASSPCGRRCVSEMAKELCPELIRPSFRRVARPKKPKGPKKRALSEIIEILKARGEWPREVA